jgi:hypothetical protein
MMRDVIDGAKPSLGARYGGPPTRNLACNFGLLRAIREPENPPLTPTCAYISGSFTYLKGSLTFT